MFERRPGRTTINLDLHPCGSDGVCERRMSMRSSDGSIPKGSVLKIQGRPDSENRYIGNHAQEIISHYAKAGFHCYGQCNCPESNGCNGLVGICFVNGAPDEE